ncbi:MAG: hypothetical protein NT003_03735 [Candidatus Magasanikbacteria bacterium]|nr:hypothetical protein [Candidatus Magasanikbacteria bacterium]
MEVLMAQPAFVEEVMNDPIAALKLARGELQSVCASIQVTSALLTMLEAAHKVKEKIRTDPLRAQIYVYELVMQLLSDEESERVRPASIEHLGANFSASIREARSAANAWARYLPTRMMQLISSDGIVGHIEDPALLLVAIFWPEDLAELVGVDPPAGTARYRDSEMELLRSAIALRTWIRALQWLPERHVMARGNVDLMQITAWFEQNFFAHPDSTRNRRKRPVLIQFDPDRAFTFHRVVSAREAVRPEHTIEIPLSRRYIKVGDRLVRVYFDARVKSNPSGVRRVANHGDIHDLVACSIVFETAEDYEAVFPHLSELVLPGSKPKVVRGERVNGKINHASAGMKGVLWSGVVSGFGTGVCCELECSTLERYYNGKFSLTLFNHQAYEVRRLLLKFPGSELRFWETIFPGSLHVELTDELRVEMVMRQLRLVLSDTYWSTIVVRRRAREWLDRLEEVLLRNPEAIDDPSLEPDLLF